MIILHITLRSLKVQNIATIEENKNVRPMNKINAVLIELIPCNKLGFANPYINYLSNLMSKKLDISNCEFW